MEGAVVEDDMSSMTALFLCEICTAFCIFKMASSKTVCTNCLLTK